MVPGGGELEEARPSGHGRARGLVSSRRSGARVEARSYAVPEDLAGVVESIWTGSWDLRGQPPHQTRLLGDPCVHLVFEDSDAAREARVVGVWTRLWTRTLEGRGRVWGVKFRPGGVRAVLPEPASTWTDTRALWTEARGRDDELVEGVLSAGEDADTFSLLEGWLRERARPDDSVRQAVRIMGRLMSEPTLGSVDELARDEGMSKRTLQRLFKGHVGAPPKWALMRRRVQEAALRMERGDVGDLAALALALGYADQAHMTRDFKAMTGSSPRAFMRQVWT